MKMNATLHETCPQYVARRLSEGWKLVWHQGYHLVLSSPDGNILRPVDLRNDIETLRPNAAGDECNIEGEDGCSACPNHYDCVDEVEADDATTIVLTLAATYQRDLYNLPASSGSGTINFIKIYFRCRGPDAKARPALKSNSIVTDGTEIATNGGYTTYSQQWNTNPATSQPWGSDWSVIDALQIGVSLKQPVYKSGSVKCTQVYVEVDYTPIAPPHSYHPSSHQCRHNHSHRQRQYH